MQLSRFPQQIGCMATVLTIFACSDREPSTAPGPKLNPPNPSSMTGALSSFSASLGTPGGQTLALPTYAAYPEGIKLTFTVSGQINVITDTAHASYFHTANVNVGPGGVNVGGVYNQCSVGVQIAFGATGYATSCNPPAPPGQGLGYDTSSTWSVTAVMYGGGSATRTFNIPTYTPGPCDTVVCHTYSGGQTITVVPLAGDLDLQARYFLESRTVRKGLFIHPFTNTDTYAHQTVSFTDSTTPRGLPIKALSNTWTMMDPTAPPGYWNHTQVPAACLGSSPLLACSVDIRETGIWAAAARVNGVEHDDDITIYCAESEALLNNDVLRQQLLSALDSSNANDPDYHNRFERFFFVFQDTVTPGAMPYLVFTPHQPTDDVCHVETPVLPGPALLPPNTKFLGTGHDHPSESFTVVKCRDSNGNQTIPQSTVYGASKADIKEERRVNLSYPNAVQFIIDKHNVYLVRPGATLGDEHLTGNEFSWDGLMPPRDDRLRRRCGWPKKTVY